MIALILAMIAVESGGDTGAVNGDHVGVLQISRIYVRECNRILGEDVYKYKDRYDRAASISMTNIYLTHYAQVYEARTGVPATWEVLARVHNGGPRGYQKQSTESYWRRVSERLERREEANTDAEGVRNICAVVSG